MQTPVIKNFACCQFISSWCTLCTLAAKMRIAGIVGFRLPGLEFYVKIYPSFPGMK